MDKRLGNPLSRRTFLAAATAAPAVLSAASMEKPALLGGKPVRTERFPGWPVRDGVEEKAILEVVRSGKWGRGTGDTVAALNPPTPR
jgi:hypothetical protein